MEAVQTTFDYALIEPETRIVVQQRTSEIKSLMRRAAHRYRWGQVLRWCAT